MNLSADERAAQSEQIRAAFDAMKGAAASAGISMPIDGATYALSTPLRDGRYAASQGIGKALTGAAELTDAAKWIFRKRTDADTYNIINAADGGHVSPSAATNSALKTMKSQPTRGWTPKAADEIGYMILTSNKAQWNQTNATLQYQIYNWGEGTNISDTGCKFRFELVALPEPANPDDPDSAISETETAAGEAKAYTLTGTALRSLSGARPGVYLIDGKKQVIH